jgi:uncharacterized protein (UPF0303 family)
MPAEQRDELIARIEQQQRRLVLSRFDNDDAWRLGCGLVDIAREEALPVVIDIRRNGQQLFHYALPGTCADSDEWILRKSRVVTRYGAPSYLVGLRFEARGTSFDADSRLDRDTYAAHGGSFPITIRDAGIVGAVTASGLAQGDDHDLVVNGLERFIAEQA